MKGTLVEQADLERFRRVEQIFHAALNVPAGEIAKR